MAPSLPRTPTANDHFPGIGNMISVQDLAAMRGWKCECCGWPSMSLERHHVFLHRMRRFPELDDERNIQLVCRDCHANTANCRDNRLKFWKVQLVRYPDLREWYEDLPLKIKERFE
jgi:hypothetical protein